MRSDPDQPRPLTVREALEFLRIIETETNTPARRLLDYWAHPANLGPYADKLLTETFKKLWRT